MLSDRDWRISYSSNEHNPILDFYIPALESAFQYDRKSGFFSSAILSKVAAGLGALLQNEGKMRLIMGCQFNPQDLEAIQRGYSLREALQHRLDAALVPPQTFAQLKHFEILSWLIQYGYLDIKIAIPLKKDGIPESPERQLDPRHIFHEKVGIFTDRAHNQLVCFGSNNESLSGWEQNIEAFHVYCSWDGDRDAERVNEEIYRFEQLWNDIAPNIKLFDVPEAVRAKLLRYTPSSKPTWNSKHEFDTRAIDSHPSPTDHDCSASVSLARDSNNSLARDSNNSLANNSNSLANNDETDNNEKTDNNDENEKTDNNDENEKTDNNDENEKTDNNNENNKTREQDAPTTAPLTEAERDRERETFAPLLNLHEHPGCLDFCLKSIPIQPWPHQFKILRRIAETFPRSFLIADEVGLGKTIETGLILRYLLVSRKIERVLILAPASVQPQWQDELREKFNLHFWSYVKGQFKDPYGNTDNPDSQHNPWNRHNLILASSHLVRRRDRQRELLEAEPWDLIILDEAHHARRKTPKARKDTPNSLLKLLRQLREKTNALILLSATPMQIDPIEVFDLLSLLGLQGHWRYGENFCNYFATLGERPDRFILEFWQQMSVDYFKYSGEPCPRLQQYLSQQDRLLAYKLQDTWQRGKAIVNPKQTCGDTPFINASRQYLTVNTPLKDLMFRHTRDTLRQYYRRGLLDRDIPQRIVQDSAIALERDREIPLYQAVSDYVRNFYRLAQKQERKALGFLMTLYRKRLTSSFYAIRESLQRRLEGISITPDDLADLDDADDAIIEGLEDYLEPVDPQEIQYLEDLLRQFENTGEDSKLSFLLETLRHEFLERESAIVFTQYTDTMDYLREELRSVYGDRLACYSGRGGELPARNPEPHWQIVPKERIKHLFRQGEIKLLLCTESASEGLNLQTCGVLINYDLPWNPMRVEQRIGRLDRIGQRYPTVKIHNFYYDGTVEAKVYKRLRERIGLFVNIVGNLQPILAQVPTFIEEAVMSADPEEEDVLMANFEEEFDIAPLRPSLDEMVEMDVEADIAELQHPLHPSPIDPDTLEILFTTSKILKAQGFEFAKTGERTWQLSTRSARATYDVTFYPANSDSLTRLMSFGDPLFGLMLEALKS